MIVNPSLYPTPLARWNNVKGLKSADNDDDNNDGGDDDEFKCSTNCATGPFLTEPISAPLLQSMQGVGDRSCYRARAKALSLSLSLSHTHTHTHTYRQRATAETLVSLSTGYILQRYTAPARSIDCDAASLPPGERATNTIIE